MNNLIDFIKTKTEQSSYYFNISRNQVMKILFTLISIHMTSSWLNAVDTYFKLCVLIYQKCNGINSSDSVYGDFATTVGTRIE